MSPAASAVGVVDFIDEWISAPYPQQRGDREIVLAGLAWIEAESQKRFGKAFRRARRCAEERDRRRHLLACEGRRRSSPTAAKFFAKFRDLTAGGFYTTPVGMKDIGYVGNVPLEKFDGPPLEVLKKAGLGLTAPARDGVATAARPRADARHRPHIHLPDARREQHALAAPPPCCRWS